MRIMRLCLAVALLSLLVPSSAIASPARQISAEPTILHVSPAAADLQLAATSVPNGGVIELAQGTYSLPAGLILDDLQKSFTMRAAPGAQVILDGQGIHPVLTIQNTSATSGGPYLFKGISFANGYTAQEGRAGGVTLYQAQATFVDCSFLNNVANVRTTVGGAVYVAESSRVFFFNTSWTGNSNPTGGAGLGIRSQSQVYVHNSQFTNNTSISQDANAQSGGAGINMGNSTLRVSNTRFDSNRAGGHGAGLYVIGNWSNPTSTPRADVIVANSTFINNSAQHAPGVQNLFPTQGGAVNIEDQSLARIYNSRFISNNAMVGGGINVFRAQVEVRSSVFLGNQATGPTAGSGYGGAIAANSADPTTPASSLIVEDTLIQGRVGSTSTAAVAAGGILIAGNGVSRGKAVLNRVVFYDVDTAARNAGDSGTAGALEAAGATLTMQKSLVLNCDTSGGSAAAGGGVMVLGNSVANIDGTSFFHNTAGWSGGALWVHGSALSLSNSALVANQVGAGAGGPASTSYGAAIFTAPAQSPAVAATGPVANNVFSGNAGLAIFDDDRANGPINDTRYNNNSFFETSYGDKVYQDGLASSQNAGGLNNLVVTRAAGVPSTDKSQSDNHAAQSAIPVGTVLAVPPVVLPAGAAGDPAGSTTAYLAYAYSVGPARLDGSTLSRDTGLVASAAPGSHTLASASGSSTTTVRQGMAPAATLTASSGGSGSTLTWHLTSGTFLDAAIDREVSTAPGTAGSVSVSGTAGTAYHYYAITQEGGVMHEATIGSPALGVSSQGWVLGAPNYPHPYGSIQITNTGGGEMSWSATASGPNAARIHLSQASGQTESSDNIILWVDVAGLAAGVYTDYINIDIGTGSGAQVPLTTRVVPQVRLVRMPLTRK